MFIVADLVSLNIEVDIKCFSAVHVYEISIVVRIPACHAGDRDSISRRGELSVCLSFYIEKQGAGQWNFSL